MKDAWTFANNYARLEGGASPREFNFFLLLFVALFFVGAFSAAFRVDRYDSVLMGPCLLIGTIGLFHATVRRLRSIGRDWPIFACYVRVWSVCVAVCGVLWVVSIMAGYIWPRQLFSTVIVLAAWTGAPALLAAARAMILTNENMQKPIRKWNWSDD